MNQRQQFHLTYVIPELTCKQANQNHANSLAQTGLSPTLWEQAAWIVLPWDSSFSSAETDTTFAFSLSWVEWRPARPYTNACSQGLTAGRDGFVKSLRTGLKSLKHVKTLRLRHRAAERSESSCSCVLFTSQISCLNGQFSLNGLLRREEQTSLVEVSLSQRQERSSISPNAAFPDLSGRILRTSGCTQISQSSEIAFLLAIFMLWTRTLELIFHFQHFKYHTLQKQKSSLASGITVLPNQMSIIPILHSNTS